MLTTLSIIKILLSFFIPSGRKAVEEIINTTWEIERAPAALHRQKLKRINILSQAKEDACVCRTRGEWLQMAQTVLDNNYIDRDGFSQSFRVLLQEGRGKYRNILLTGPANCGKTFLLSPLSKIFQCFHNPAATSFAWLGAEEAEVLLLNDFRWNSKVCMSKKKLNKIVLPTVVNVFALYSHAFFSLSLFLISDHRMERFPATP